MTVCCQCDVSTTATKRFIANHFYHELPVNLLTCRPSPSLYQSYECNLVLTLESKEIGPGDTLSGEPNQ